MCLHHGAFYLNEQFTSKTELDKEPEEHASKHHFQDVSEAPDPCVGSILNLRVTTITVYSALQIQRNT